MQADIFDNVGVKIVTKTDKNKGAFVPNDAQKRALFSAGISPGKGGPAASILTLSVLGDPSTRQLTVSYYDSIRVGAGRTGETRMGRQIVQWMEIGDELAIANVGSTVFVWKEKASSLSLNELAGAIARVADPADLIAKARKAKGAPKKVSRTIADFQRNSAVVAGALARSGGKCEMPCCVRPTFLRPDGSHYLEVHHITPLAEGGDDTLLNAAALCPTCHRELHYGVNKLKLRAELRLEIAKK